MQVKLPEHAESPAAAATVLHALRNAGGVLRHEVHGAYLRLELDGCADADCLEDTLLQQVPGSEVVSLGRRLEILKQVGSPDQLDATYHVSRLHGTHGIGHTRLSTESRVDLSHSQPFWAHGVPDLATVHNGHITNYHKLRRRYEQRGYRFFTENDSEVIGIYLRDRMAAGLSLDDALRSSLDDFDGSFSYLAASGDRLAYVKDRFGFKPLMLAETDDFRRPGHGGDRPAEGAGQRLRGPRAGAGNDEGVDGVGGTTGARPLTFSRDAERSADRIPPSAPRRG